MQRRSLFRVLPALALATCGPGLAFAEAAWPARPIRLIVPFPPGGAIDAMARLLAPVLASTLGQPVVVENRADGGGTIGTAAAAQSTDAHTLLMVSMAHAVNPALSPHLPYDGLRDFVAVAPVAVVPNLLVVPRGSPWESPADVIAAAHHNPGVLTYASAGSGTSIHLAGALFAALSRIELTHVPYKGSGPALSDLVTGRVDMMFDSLTSAAPQLASGRLRALAVTTSRRIAALPRLPTLAEAGVAGYALDPWFAMLAPADLPPEGQRRMEAAVTGALRDPVLRDRLAGIGAEPMDGGAESLDRLLRQETARWKDLVRELSIRPD